MVASPPKNDAWPQPKHVRHVWIAGPGRLMPRQGLVVEWRQRASGWTALVAYVDESKRNLILEWVRSSELWPVATDPNRRGRFTGSEDRW